MERVFHGRVKVTPLGGRAKPFFIPEAEDETRVFCIKAYDGKEYLHTGKTPESASNSYPMQIVEIFKEEA